MASMWRRAMVYLGLQDDDELDYGGGDYEPYGDYADPARLAPGAERQRRRRRRRAPGVHLGPSRGPQRLRHGAGHPRLRPRSRPGAAAHPRDEPPVTSPRPSVVRTIGPTTAARVHVIEPSGFGDAPEVGDRLKANQPVILNLQGLPKELQRRLIDFSSGLAYAVGGKMKKVNDEVFLLTPTDVEVSQEEKERLQARGLYQA